MPHTSEQKRAIFYTGGLSQAVTLSGRKVTLGELSMRDRYKIFECMEGDLIETEKAWVSYIGVVPRGLIGFVKQIMHKVIGLPEKRNFAISTMKKYIEGLTENDIRLIQLCAAGRNGKDGAFEIRDIVMSSPSSEVQEAIRVALELNGIDTKKYLAARRMAVPTDAA
jgi:hypothetical protein